MNRKIFIDCGFYNGMALTYFKSTPEYSSDFINYGFDPMMKVEKAKTKWPNFILDNKAIWTNDGEIDFYISNRHSGKANGVSHNGKARNETKIRVQCMDFSKWLKNNFDDKDYIVLKMDVEGAEYELLPKMIQDKTIDLIDIIYLEWHPARVGDEKWVKAKQIVKLFDKDLIIRKSLERYVQALRVKTNKEKGKT